MFSSEVAPAHPKAYQFLQAFLFFPSPQEGALKEAGSGFFRSSASSSSSESIRSWRVLEAMNDTVVLSANEQLTWSRATAAVHPCVRRRPPSYPGLIITPKPPTQQVNYGHGSCTGLWGAWELIYDVQRICVWRVGGREQEEQGSVNMYLNI